MRFRKSLEQIEALAVAYREGLQALRSRDRARIRCTNSRLLAGSVDLDAALRAELPNDPRWDYAIGLRLSPANDGVVWIEVHPACTSDVKQLLRKLDWLDHWLRTRATSLRSLPREVIWLASGGVKIPKTAPQLRQLAARGKQPREHVNLNFVRSG